MEYGLFIRNQRTQKWVNLSAFAKVLHHWSGTPADNAPTADVPGMNTLLLPVTSYGNAVSAWFSGANSMHRKPVSDVGVQAVERAWHAVTLITDDASLPEGVRDDLESVPGAGCILNYEDNCFYTSPHDIQRRTRIPVRVLTGVVYE